MSDDEYYKRYGKSRGGRPKKNDDTEKDRTKKPSEDLEAKKVVNYLKSVGNGRK